MFSNNKRKKGTYVAQQRIKEENSAKILSLLKDGPQRFTFLQNESSLSPAGLTKILDRLMEKRKIKKILKDNKMAYELSSSVKLEELISLGSIINKIKDKGGHSYLDYSISRNLPPDKVPYGIESHLVIDKNLDNAKLNPFTKKDVYEIEEFIYKKIANKIRSKKLRSDESKEGTIVLGFRIDYNELIYSIKHPLIRIGGRLVKG